MPAVILTLHYPKGLRRLPIATTTDPGLLRLFKEAVLDKWHQKIESSPDEAEAVINRLEYELLRKTIGILIPDESWDGSCIGDV